MERREEIKWRVEFARCMLESARQRGYIVKQAEPFVESVRSSLEENKLDEVVEKTNSALDILRQPLKRKDVWPYHEPDELEGILRSLTAASPVPSYDMSQYKQDALGGWVGQVIGSALGLAVENWSAEKIREEIGEITGYIQTPPQTRNDDTTFQVIALHTLEQHGVDFEGRDLAEEWLEHISFAPTAEGVAIENLKKDLNPPQSAHRDNPYAEWVGGAMKATIWGLLTPGRPDLAARYAYRDAIIAHQGNGIYSALYTAALVSLAFVMRDISRLIELACEFVPAESRLAELVEYCISIFHECETWEQAHERYRSAYRAYHRTVFGYVHVFPCLVAALIGFHYGEGDFGRSIAIATMCGRDTDFPPALIGAVLGIWAGESGIPDKWREPVGYTFETMASGMEHLSYATFAAWICKQGRCIVGRDK